MVWIICLALLVGVLCWAICEWHDVRKNSLADLHAFERAKKIYGKSLNLKVGGKDIKPIEGNGRFVTGFVYVNEYLDEIELEAFALCARAHETKEKAKLVSYASVKNIGVKYRVTFERME